MDHIRVHRGGEPVRDDDRGATKCELPEAFEPVCFGPGIERARRFIENDNRCASQKGTRECDALPLADTQLRASGEPAAEQCLFLIRQTRNDLLRTRGAKCGFDLNVRGRQPGLLPDVLGRRRRSAH